MDLRLAADWQPAKSTPLLQISGELNPLQGEGDAVRWGKLRKVANAIYGSSSPHGRPAALRCSAKYIVVGTETADVLVFDYQQELQVKLTPPPLDNGLYGPVTALSVSQDETCVAAGFASGYVIVWTISAPQIPKLYVPPQATVQRRSNSVPANESHMVGSAVCFVFFVGSHRSVVMSFDNHGLIFLHQSIRILLGNTVRSRKIGGQYIQKQPTTILAAALIRQPNAPLLIVTTSPTTLRGVSINPPRAHFRFSSTLDSVDTNTGLTASLAYCETTQKLAYSWGNVLKIVSLNWNGQDYVVTVERMLKGPESFVFVQWFTKDMLVVLTITQELQFLSPDLKILDQANILRKFPLQQDYYSAVLRDGRTPVVADAFYNALQVQDANIFILGRHEFEYGSLSNWADSIMSLLNQSKPVSAVLLALQYYTSDYDLSMIGLDNNNRRELVAHALPDVIVTSMRFCMAYDTEQFPKLLAVSMQAIVTTRVPLLEQLMDMITNQEFRAMYFEFLVSFVLDGSITHLPPKVFKELVQAKADSRVIQDILLSLDTSTLDIDLAFTICDEYKLEEARIFLLNMVLRDFVTPLKTPSSNRFPYLSYVLSGRAYPTERPLPDPIEAKTSVYNYLFDTDHVPLENLVEEDAASFVMALNEAFEDPDLNDDEEQILPVSRQTIFNILFDNVKNPYFDVFVARNFPKYQQYLMVTGSRLDRVLANLIDSPLPKEERELAILSLLSVHKPAQMDKVLQMLHEEKFYSVLEKLYRDQKNYKKMIKTALENPLGSVWSLLPGALNLDFKGVYPLAVTHLSELIKKPRELAEIMERYPDYHVQVLKSDVDPDAKFDYFDAVFSLVGEHSQLPPPVICNEYVILLAERDGERLDWVLEHTITQPENVNLPLVVDSLIENRRTGPLALLLCRLNRKSEAMIYLKNHIRTREADENIDHYVDQAVGICREVSLIDENEANNLWKDLLEAQLASGFSVKSSLRVLVEGPQKVAINVIASLIPEVNGQMAASLIEELYSAMAIQLAALEAIQSILEKDSYREFVGVLNERLKGWSISVNGECEGCGRKAFGLGINADVVYGAWKAKIKGEDHLKDILVIFQCQHAYHMACMQKLTSETKCILCYAD